jgi:two-component system, OmpR family, alkaline phosphatase synthesis response regulator PhoP
MARILIVEDNPDLAFGLRNNLEIEGYEIDTAEDGLTGLARIRTWRPHLVILDLMMPGMDGYRVLRTLREEGNNTPVLILSARGDEADKLRGFRFGADDFVTKPFSILELLARVQALLRRAGPEPRVEPGEAYRFGSVSVDTDAQSVARSGVRVRLTHREYDLLLALLRRSGGVVTRQDLLREVWGHQGAVTSRTVDTHIAELRRKLEEDPGRPRHIMTVRKTGYRIQP